MIKTMRLSMLTACILSLVGSGGGLVVEDPCAQPGPRRNLGNAARLYVKLFDSVVKRLGPDVVSSELTLSAEQVGLLVKATSIRSCRFYPQPFGRLILSVNCTDEFNRLLPRVQLCSRIARAALNQARQAEARGDSETATRLMEAVVRFGAHLREQDDAVIERLKGLLIERVALEALRDLHKSRGDKQQEKEATIRLDRAERRGRATGDKMNRAERDAGCYSRIREVWLKDPGILWRKEALLRMVFHYNTEGKKADRQRVLDVLAWCATDDPEPSVRESAENLLRHVERMKPAK